MSSRRDMRARTLPRIVEADERRHTDFSGRIPGRRRWARKRASPSCGARWVKPVTFAIASAVSPCGCMVRKSSSAGGALQTRNRQARATLKCFAERNENPAVPGPLGRRSIPRHSVSNPAETPIAPRREEASRLAADTASKAATASLARTWAPQLRHRNGRKGPPLLPAPYREN